MKQRVFRKLAIVWILVGVFLFITGCPGGTQPNTPPSKPSNPNPADKATDVSTTPTLSWSCSDPDGDSLTFDIYFGTDQNPPLVKSNHTGTNYQPGTLQYSTTYYWKIVAKDGKGGVTEGDVWSFSTIAIAGNLSILAEIPLEINNVSGPVYSSPAMGPDGKIYIGSQGGYLVISPTSYIIVDRKVASPVWSSAVVDYRNNVVYFADNDGYLHVYPSKTSYKISGYSIYAAPVVVGDYIYVVDLLGQIMRVSKANPASYSVINNLGKEIRSSPVAIGGKLFIASVDGCIFAVNLPGGTVQWQKQVSDNFYGGFAVDTEGNLYIAGTKLWCINSTNGSILWSYDLAGQAYGNPVISENGTVYIGDMSGTLHAVKEGQLIWEKQNLGSILSSCVIGDNGVIYVAGDTYMLAINPFDGSVISSVELRNYVESNPVLHFGKLFVADEAGYLYVISALSSSIQDPDVSWPMFQRDWYHTATR